jgi:hypothetical protein
MMGCIESVLAKGLRIVGAATIQAYLVLDY